MIFISKQNQAYTKLLVIYNKENLVIKHLNFYYKWLNILLWIYYILVILYFFIIFIFQWKIFGAVLYLYPVIGFGLGITVLNIFVVLKNKLYMKLHKDKNGDLSCNTSPIMSFLDVEKILIPFYFTVALSVISSFMGNITGLSCNDIRCILFITSLLGPLSFYISKVEISYSIKSIINGRKKRIDLVQFYMNEFNDLRNRQNLYVYNFNSIIDRLSLYSNVNIGSKRYLLALNIIKHRLYHAKDFYNIKILISFLAKLIVYHTKIYEMNQFHFSHKDSQCIKKLHKLEKGIIGH